VRYAVVASLGVWRSLVACFVRDEEVVGSNPATPTRVIAVRGPDRLSGSGPSCCRADSWSAVAPKLQPDEQVGRIKPGKVRELRDLAPHVLNRLRQSSAKR
jgi:hypothetical protein